MSNGVRDLDLGWKRLKRMVRKEAYVEIGFLGVKGSARHKSSRQSVAQIASYHEWGTVHIPKRSMLDDWVVQRRDKILEAGQKVAVQVVDGRSTLSQGLGKLGAFAQGDVQARIARGIPPALDEATIRRKGSSKPLIDTGQMRASIGHRLKVK